MLDYPKAITKAGINDIVKKNVILLYGDQDILMEEILEKIIFEMVDKNFIEFDYMSFNGEHLSGEKDEKSLDIKDIIEQLESFPFGSMKKLISLKNPEKFSLAQRNNLANYITGIPSNSILVLMTILKGKSTIGSSLGSKLEKILKTSATMVNCSLKTNEMINWLIQKTAELTGKTIGFEETKYLINRSGIDLRNLINEIKKLSSFVEPGFRITRDAIETCSHQQAQSGVFELTDAVEIGQTYRALSIFSNLIEQQEEPLKLLALMGNHFNLITQARKLKEKKIPDKEIIKILQEMGEHPFRVQKALNNRYFSLEGLKKSNRWIQEADLSIKTGRQSPSIVMELLIILLSQEAKKSRK